MANFSTHLSLGQTAYVVQRNGYLDFTILPLTIGQIRTYTTDPKYKCGEDTLFKEEYMCVETGIGSGTLWQYGKSIFATREEAEKGKLILEQKLYFERKVRDEALKKHQEEEKERDLATLKRLKEQYEV